ncbi:MAG: hypothetical protein JWQ71_3665 [Pedosphaera sp.]|nr:hypothetical protein [Pedosphaera sp.]
MKREDILAHRTQLDIRLEALEVEKAKLVRQRRAIDILLEGSDFGGQADVPSLSQAPEEAQKEFRGEKRRRRVVPAHAVRTSHRSSLIDAVKEVAMKQPGAFDSSELLKALQSEYPEFQLKETKHISSPLSDLVKRGVLILGQKRIGSKSNVYRAQAI